MKVEFSRPIVEKSSDMKFRENASSGRRTDGRTDVTEVTVAFQSFEDESGTLKTVQKLVSGLLRETRVSFFSPVLCSCHLYVFGGRVCPVLVCIVSNFRVSHYEMFLSVHVEKFVRPLRKDYFTGTR